MFLCAGDPTGEVLLQRVESLAQAHDAHAQMFELCEFLGDQERLHRFMTSGSL